MKKSFVLTPSARKDIVAIWDYVADSKSERSADRVIARIFDECERLAVHPAIGHFREDLLSRDYRFWSVWSYLIVYRWKTRPLQVIAVVHGARDLEAFFDEDR